jgi:thiamine-phosphate pyrophosphorylase
LPVVVSSRVDVALAAGAAGVHLPERDLPVAATRRLLPDRLIGRSVHSVAAARAAAADGADYLLFGPVFATPSHADAAPVGLEALAEVAAAVTIPVLAIGGVDGTRLAECLAVGAGGYAAIREFA